MKKCSRCGRAIDEDSNFCSACGAKVADTEEGRRLNYKNKKVRNTAIIVVSVIIIIGMFGGLMARGVTKSSQVKRQLSLGNSIWNKVNTRKQF